MSNVINSIRYKGEVTVQTVDKNKRVIKEVHSHNEGCSPLFEFLINCLARKYSSELVPNFIRCFYQATNNPEDLNQNILSSLGHYQARVSKVESVNNESFSVTYSFFIPNNSFRKIETGNVVATVALYNNANADITYIQNPSAIVTLPNPITAENIKNEEDVIIL